MVFRKLFQSAGFKVIREELQLGFPSELFRVKLFALSVMDLTPS